MPTVYVRIERVMDEVEKMGYSTPVVPVLISVVATPGEAEAGLALKN